MLKRSNKVIIAAGFLVSLVLLSYTIKFFGIYGFSTSDDPAVWGQFGDYLGGSLNPILSFCSILLLLKSISLQNSSLNLQNDANDAIRAELARNEKSEKFNSFNTVFFNLINSQHKIFERVSIHFPSSTGYKKLISDSAVFKLENELDLLNSNLASRAEIVDFIEDIDQSDKIYGVVRAFYITTKLIFDRISDSNGFSREHRKEQIIMLINFLEFSHVRLILIGIQFIDGYHSTFLKENSELSSAMNELGLNMEMF